ncbi:MAG TPA: hypothetical protein V6C81_27825 [Planktothrix sp.]|jgi:hypothetical protein
MSETQSTCKLFVIQARKAPVAAIFRRGPADYVQLLKWNLKNDTFEEGQWLHGRIYERRCDLSPDGTKLLYFAARFQSEAYDPSYTNAWTAVARLPWLTAIALWPKGDSNAGGGLFHDDNHIWLNHRADKAVSHPNHQPPKDLFVNPNQWASGEDYPIYANHLERDGWRYTQHGDFRLRGGKWVTEREERCVKPDPTRRFELEMTLTSISPNALQYIFALTDLVTGKTAPFDADNWADWDSNGRLVFAKEGRLFAAQPAAGAEFDARQLADFTAHKFQPIEAPASALVW